jgi:hypothetical protein
MKAYDMRVSISGYAFVKVKAESVEEAQSKASSQWSIQPIHNEDNPVDIVDYQYQVQAREIKKIEKDGVKIETFSLTDEEVDRLTIHSVKKPKATSMLERLRAWLDAFSW